MTCYFHQNLAYIGFKSYDQMIAACQLRLYTEDDRLLTGRPRIAYPTPASDNQDVSAAITQPKAMSFQTGITPDLKANQQPHNHRNKKRKSNTKLNREYNTMVINECSDEKSDASQSIVS